MPRPNKLPPYKKGDWIRTEMILLYPKGYRWVVFTGIIDRMSLAGDFVYVYFTDERCIPLATTLPRNMVKLSD